jgi:hypothetical protein
MTENSTPPQGVMFKFTYRSDPKHNPQEVFDVVRFFQGSDATMLNHNAKNHAMKTGALDVTTLSEQQYKELLNEEAKRTQTDTITA